MQSCLFFFSWLPGPCPMFWAVIVWLSLSFSIRKQMTGFGSFFSLHVMTDDNWSFNFYLIWIFQVFNQMFNAKSTWTQVLLTFKNDITKLYKVLLLGSEPLARVFYDADDMAVPYKTWFILNVFLQRFLPRLLKWIRTGIALLWVVLSNHCATTMTSQIKFSHHFALCRQPESISSSYPYKM